MKECDKRNSHISSKLHIYIYIYIFVCVCSGRHLVTKTFTPLYYTSPNYTSLPLIDTSFHLTFTHLHFTLSHLA
jgi:hypothetical protein